MRSLEQIREQERKSHIEIYSTKELYSEGSWLKKPIKTVEKLMPLFDEYSHLRILDLGCGVGRNCIAIAQHFCNIPCEIECVDILPFAIEKLEENAVKYGVSESIHGIVSSIDDFIVKENYYDWILIVSALEHMDCVETFTRKLYEIQKGIRKNGIVCMVINSDVTEFDKTTGLPLPAQFEVNIPTKELQLLLMQTFEGWQVLKSTVQSQRYDIPRENNVSDLRSNVVTFVARK